MATENPIPPQRTWADFQLRFPPFPQAPEGVEIVPFKDYKEVGILKETPDRVERDALQVPTVAIKPHSTDWCKTNARVAGRMLRSSIQARWEGFENGGTIGKIWRDESNQAATMST